MGIERSNQPLSRQEVFRRARLVMQGECNWDKRRIGLCIYDGRCSACGVMTDGVFQLNGQCQAEIDGEEAKSVQ